MIIEIRAKYFSIFEGQVALSMNANMRNKKFASDIYTEDKYHILKTVGRYGPYNAGKICLVKGIQALQAILLDKETYLVPNIFLIMYYVSLELLFINFHHDIKENLELFSYSAKRVFSNER